MANQTDILKELARRSAVRPCPEIVWQKFICRLPDYRIKDERHEGEEYAVLSGSTTLGSGSGVGVIYKTKKQPISLGSVKGYFVVGQTYMQAFVEELDEPDLTGFRTLKLMKPDMSEEIDSPVISAKINYRTGEIVTQWDRSSLIGDRFMAIDYEYEESGCISPDAKEIYFTGKNPYDLDNPLEWGFVVVAEPKAANSVVNIKKIHVFQNGVCKFNYKIDDTDNSEFAQVINNLFEEIKEVEQEELMKWFLQPPEEGGIQGAIISTSGSVIAPGTIKDDEFNENCTLEDYYTFTS